MVIRIHNLDKWQRLPEGKLLVLPAEGQRKIRLALNVSAPTHVEVVQGDKGTFLTVVNPGAPETLEFTIEGTAQILCTTEGEVWHHSHEGEETSFDVPDAQTFTRIASRRARNPQLEMMMFKAEQNMARRLNALAAEYEERIQAAGVRHDLETGEIDEDDGGQGEGSGASGEGPAVESAELSSAGAVRQPPA